MLTPNYAINPTPEQALRSNRAVLPARVIAALGITRKSGGAVTDLFSMLVIVTTLAANPNSLSETACFFLLKFGEEDVQTVKVPGLSVLNPPSDQPEFVVDLDKGVELEGVICNRSRPMIAVSDFRVTKTGLPFYINSGEPGEPDSIIIVLEQTEVGHRVRLIDGRELGKEEEEEMVEVIEAINERQHGKARDGDA